MKIESLLSCSETLGELVHMFGNMPGNTKSTEASLSMAMAQLYVTELAHHLHNGKDMFDAVEATACGQMAVPPEKALILQILTAKPKA